MAKIPAETQARFDAMTVEEKAALSDDEVNHMVGIALMESGIKVVSEPGQTKFLLPKPVVKTKKFYQVQGVNFLTAAQAERFMTLHPYTSDYDWDMGRQFKYPEEIQNKMAVVELYDKTDLREKAPLLMDWENKRREWEAQTSRYQSYLQSRNSLSAAIWKIFNDARADWQEAQEIKAAYQEYVTLAGGNHEIAQNFLIKTYGEEKARAAFPPEPEPEPAQEPIDSATPDNSTTTQESSEEVIA